MDRYCLIHRDGKVTHFFQLSENDVVHHPTTFIGTKAECEAEIINRNLLHKVYSTEPDGEHYHLESCQYIQEDDAPVEWESVNSAVESGLEPCEVCIV